MLTWLRVDVDLLLPFRKRHILDSSKLKYFADDLCTFDENGGTYWKWVPRPGGSVMSVSYSWPGGCEFGNRLRWNFFQAYFRLSPLQNHVRKVVGGFEKKFELVLMWESQETHVRHRPPWYDLSCWNGVSPQYNQPTNPQVGRKHCRERRNCSLRAISPFPTVFSKKTSAADT